MFVDEDSEAATLYAASEKEIRANARLINAKATQRKLLGGGGAAVMIGTAVWLSCQGYSSVVEKKAIAQEQATELYLAALSRATIKAEGTLKVADGGEVALKAGGQVRIDPDSVVRVTSTVPADMPRSSPEQVRRDDSKAGVVTNFTVFKTVKFGAGEVHTGWQYKDSNQQRPSFQYCYVQFTSNGATATHVDIGSNGHIQLPNPSPFPGVDLVAAFAQCQWWNEPATTQRSAAK